MTTMRQNQKSHSRDIEESSPAMRVAYAVCRFSNGSCMCGRMNRLPCDALCAVSFEIVDLLKNGANKVVGCEECGAFFEVGRGTGRRRTSRFCSTKCQNTNYNRRRVAK